MSEPTEAVSIPTCHHSGGTNSNLATGPISHGAVVVQRWHIFLLLIGVFVILTRFLALHVRPLHHDESLFAYYSHHLYKTLKYEYEPILHGPFMLDVNALFYFLFGDSTYTLRLAVALLGSGIILLLLPLYRRWLGFYGMLAAMLLFAVSSTMMYYSRFFRHDIPLVFFILLGLLFLLKAFESGRASLVFWATFLFLFPICIKENTVMYYFSLVCFAILAVIVDLSRPRLERFSLIQTIFLHNRHAPSSPGREKPAKGAKVSEKEDKNKSEKRKPMPRRVAVACTFFPSEPMNWLWILAGVFGVYAGLWFLHYVTFEGTFLPFRLHTWFDPRLLGNADTIKNTHADLIQKGAVVIQNGRVFLQQGEALLFKTISPTLAWVFHGTAVVVILFVLLWLRWLSLNQIGADALVTRLWALLRRNYHAVIGGVILFMIVYVLLFTTFFRSDRFFPAPPPENATPAQLAAYKPRSVLLSYNETILYWHGQHKQHRIKGPFHYYLPILLMYELPALFLVCGGAFYAMVRRRGGQAAIILWVLISVAMAIILPSLKFEGILPKDPANWHAEKFQSRWHFYYLAMYVYWGVVLSVFYLWRRQRFLAWCLFWFFTSLPLYSWAGEKVPWMTVHIALPLLLAAAIYAGKLLQSPLFQRRPAVWIVLFSLFVLWNVSLEIKLNFYNYDNVAERLIYGHTQRDVRDVAYKVYDYAERSGEREQLPILVQGESIWLFRWYFRNYNWTEYDNVKTTKRPIVILNWPVPDTETNIRENYVITKHSVRRFWQPKVLRFGVMLDIWKALIPKQYRKPDSPTARQLNDAREEWKKLTDYIIFRKPFNPPNWAWDTVSSVDFAFCVRKDFLR